MGYFDDDADAPLNTPEEVALSVIGYQQLRQGDSAGVGSVFPPRVAAATAIPVAQMLKVAALSALNGQTVVTLTWLEPEQSRLKVATYNIYVKGAIRGNQAAQLVASSMSPAQFAFQADAANAAVSFVVQTVLANGQTSPLDQSPTCGAVAASPGDAAWTNATLVNGWTNAFSTARFYKDALGVVHVSGTVTGGTLPSAGTLATLFTLPVGYRPSQMIYRVAFCLSSSAVPWTPGTAALQVSTTGAVQLGAASSSLAIGVDMEFPTL